MKKSIHPNTNKGLNIRSKSLFLILCCLLFTFGLQGQGQLNGVISYQNSGGKPASGVSVNAFGSKSVYSTDSGMFTLAFSTKKPGDKVKIIVGNSDSQGKTIEVVNTRQLEWLRIPKSADDDPIEIIICRAGQRDKAALRYYGILLNTSNKTFTKQLNKLEAQLKEKNLDAETTASLLNQIDELKVERDEAVEKLEEQAQFIASINQDAASDMVKKAIQKIEEEENVDSALAILDDAKLEEAYRLALDKKLKAEQEIRQIIEGYELKIKLLEQQFKYKEVSACYERIIEIVKANHLGQEELADYYNDIGEVYTHLVKYDKALDYHLKAVIIQEKVLGSKHAKLAISHNKISSVHYLSGQYETALEYSLKAIVIQEEVLAPKDPDQAESYHTIGVIYHETGKYEMAQEYYLKAITIQEEVLDSTDSDLANSYNSLGALYNNLGQFDKGLEYSLKAIAIQENNLDPKHPILANSYTNIANVYKALAKNDLAQEYCSKAITIQEEILDPKHPDLANSYNTMGTIFYGFNKRESALEYFLKATTIQEETLNPKHLDLANSYNNIGVLYNALKKRDTALIYYLKGTAIQEENLGPKHSKLEKSYRRIGLAYNSMKNQEKTLEYFLKVAGIQEEHLKSNDPKLAITHRNIGLLYARDKQYDKGKAALEKAESIKPEGAYIFRDWGIFYAIQGKKAKAIANLKKAVELGFNKVEWLKKNKSLDNIREEKAFQRLLSDLEKSLAKKEGS